MSATAPAVGNVLQFDGSQYVPTAPTAAPVMSVVGRTGAVVLASSDISGLGGAAILNVGTAAGTVAAGDDSRMVNAFNDTQAATSANTASTIVKRDGSGNVAVANVSSTNNSTNNIYIFDAANSVRVKAPAGLTSNYILTLPPDGGAASQILQTDGTGNLSWVNAAGGSVTATTASAPLASSGGATPNISISPASTSVSGFLSSTDWTAFSGKQSALGFAPLNPASNLSDVASAATTRTNLGLGGAAVLNVGAAAGTVAAGDDSRITGALQGSTAFSGDVTGTYNATALASSGVTAGTYAGGVTVDVKGRVTAAAALLNLTTSVSGVLPVANGGTNATSFTNTYGVNYYDGTRLVTSPAGAANQLLVQTVAGPIWTNTTFPSTTTANQLLFSSAANTVGGLASANNAVLITDASGIPSWSLISNDTYAQYARLGGRAGGQTLSGGTLANQNLTLDSTAHATKGNIILNASGGNVGIGTASPNPNTKLEVLGAAVSRANIITSGNAVNLSLSNVHVLKAVGNTTIALSNMASGGSYTLIVSDTAQTTYTFTGCTNTYFSPANGQTFQRSIFSILVIDGGGAPDCYINWVTGFN